MVISDTGEKLGLMLTKSAIELARKKNLDLVLVAPEAKPPVAKFENYGRKKFKTKKNKGHKHKQTHLKELRLKPRIDKHDVEIKVKKARSFIKQGHKVQFNMIFRGRELIHTELGLEVLENIENDMLDIAKVESSPSQEGNRLIMVLTGKKKKEKIKE